jgi:hypothetical protein
VTAVLSEMTGTWHVDLRGREVLMFTIDYRVTLHLHGESTYEGSVLLAESFELHPSGGEPMVFDPERQAESGPVPGCFRKVVDSVVVSSRDGSLLMTFTDGTTIAAESHERYEAWEVDAPGIKIIAKPGGGEPMLFRAENKIEFRRE